MTEPRTSGQNAAATVTAHFAREITAYKSRIPTGIMTTPEKVLRGVIDTINADPKLQACVPSTLVSCAIKCAMLGLVPGSDLGHCYILPFNNRRAGTVEAQLIKGYQGILHILSRCGAIDACEVEHVYKFERDRFEFSRGSSGRVLLTPDFDKRDELEVERPENFWQHLHGTLCTFLLPDGQRVSSFMTERMIAKRRAVSKQKDGPMWTVWPEEGASKTSILHGRKMIPWTAAISQSEIKRASGPDDADPHSDKYDVDYTVRDATPAPDEPTQQEKMREVAMPLPAPPRDQINDYLGGALWDGSEEVKTVVEGYMAGADVKDVKDLSDGDALAAWHAVKAKAKETANDNAETPSGP